MDKIIVTIKIVFFHMYSQPMAPRIAFIQKYQRKSALQRSGRTDQFTEIWAPCPIISVRNQWEQNYEYQENHIFQFFETFVPFKKYGFSLEKESYSAGPGSDQMDKENHTPVFQDRAYENQKPIT